MSTKIYFSNVQANDTAIENLMRLMTTSKKIQYALDNTDIEYASIYKGKGVYKGGKENSYQIELYNVAKERAVNLSKLLRKLFNQDSIMLVDETGETCFIER